MRRWEHSRPTQKHPARNAAAKKNAVRNRNYARKDALIGVYDSLIYITVYVYEYEIIIVQLREGSRPHGNK